MTAHTRFSFAIKVSSTRARDWLLEVARFVAEVVDAGEEGYTADDFDLPAEDLSVLWEILPCNTGLTIKENDLEKTGAVYIYAEDDGTVEAASLLVQEYLKRFDAEKCITFTWAEYCDSSRINEFGGGYCIVTTSAIYMSTVAEALNAKLHEVVDRDGLSPVNHG